jgi:hypothetical protein
MPGFACKSWPLIARRRALLAVKRAIKAQFYIGGTMNRLITALIVLIPLLLEVFLKHRNGGGSTETKT